MKPARSVWVEVPDVERPMPVSRLPIFRLVEYLRRQWHRELTPAGKWVVYSMFLAALGTVSVQIPVYQVFFALLALLIVAVVGGVAFRPNVTISGRFPEKAHAGEPVTGEMTVTNRGRRPTYDLSLGFFDLPAGLEQIEMDRMLPVLRPGESARIPVTLLPRRRGLYELPVLRAFSTFPFNLARGGRARKAMGSLLVLPQFDATAATELDVTPRYQQGGITLTSKIGESPEYIGNREYVPGEPARRLDFRSWARLGKPVVREYQEEFYYRIALVLDTYVPRGRRAGPDGFPDLEAAISLAASVADALSGGEYILDLFAAGPELYVFRAGRHTAHLENVLEILACVEPSRSDPLETLAPAVAGELGALSAAVCVLLDWDEPRRRLTRQMLEAGCPPKVLIVRDGTTTEDSEGEPVDLIRYTPADLGRVEGALFS